MGQRIPNHFPVTNSDRFNFVLGRTYDRQIRVAVRLNGRVDEERLARALRLTMDAEPVLGCRLTDSPKPVWMRRDDLDSRSFCSVQAAEDLEQELQRVPDELSDPFRNPLFEVKVLRGAVDALVFKFEHTAVDGGGVKDAIYLLADIYRRLGEDPGYKPTPNVKGDRSFQQVFWSASFKDKRRICRSFPHSGPTTVFPYRHPDRNRRAIALRRIGPETFRTIKSYGHGHQATVNDLLLTAFYRALSQTIPYEPGTALPVNVPVDLRAFTKKKRAGAVANLTGGFYPSVIPGGSFEETLRAVVSEMNRWKKEGIRLGGIFSDIDGIRPEMGFFKGLLTPGHDYSERTGKIVPVMTNVGIIDREKLDFGHLAAVDAYFLGSVIWPPYFTVCISTFAETLTLAAGYCREPEGEQPVEAFLDRMEEELERAII